MRTIRRVPGAAVALIATSLLGGCLGDIGAQGGTEHRADAQSPVDSATPVCTTPTPGPAPLRRLTRSEYNNTLRDLLGDTTQPANTFPPDGTLGDFDNNATALTVPELLAEDYQSTAEAMAATALAGSSHLVPCDPATAGESACAEQFVRSFTQRAFRRPPTDAEVSSLVALYTLNRMGANFTNGVTAVIEAVLQSPQFLYRLEFGVPSGALPMGVVRLAPYEMASRLSYLIWGSMPDDALFAAAAANELQTPAQLATQARRMLADPKAHPAVTEFFTEWLTLTAVISTAKDPMTYPLATDTMRASMLQETQAFVNYVMWNADGRLDTLLTAPVSFINQPLAQIYGLTGVTGMALQQTALDPTTRGGILSQPSLMTVLSDPDQSSPVLRGRFVRERLLCQTIAPPPPNLNITPPMVQPGVPTRQRFAQHEVDPTCSGCHHLMDPIGFGFEGFDAIGRARMMDEGHPVDTSGTLTGTDVDGTFTGVPGLGQRLAGSIEVANCVTTEWFRFGLGRFETSDDSCSLASIRQTFDASHHDMRELIVAITQTDAFMYRPEVIP